MMKKTLLACGFLALFTAAPARADLSMTCDIGDIRIFGGNINFENGQLNATGMFSISSRGQPYLQYIGTDGNSSNSLKWFWDGKDKNILLTAFGNISLTQIAGSSRLNISFSKPDYYDNGKTVIHHNELTSQQDCILTN